VAITQAGLDAIPERDFDKLRDLIASELGIAVAPVKRVMVETRLRKRASALGLGSFSEYCRLIQSAQGREREWPHLVDAITTHKTDFFREPAHFDYLVEQVAPDLAESCGAGLRRPLLIWSSACSTGEEPYTAAMVLSEFRDSLATSGYRFRIHATDVSAGVLETARRAVYSETTAAPVPAELRRKYMLRSSDPARRVVRMTPEIRALVEFRQLNLMDGDYRFAEPLDVVFCRNVMIYFGRDTQHRVLLRIAHSLRRGGYLLMGHSESLNGLDLPLTQIAPTVYRRTNG
jgi:chemotaxis protein methyltransferase CheR